MNLFKVFKIKSTHFKCFFFYSKSGVRAEKRDEELYFISKTDASSQHQQQQQQQHKKRKLSLEEKMASLNCYRLLRPDTEHSAPVHSIKVRQEARVDSKRQIKMSMHAKMTTTKAAAKKALIEHDQSFPRTATAKMGGYTAAVIQPPPTVASLQAQLTALQGHQAAAAVPAQPPRGGGGGGRGGGGRRGGAGGGGRASRGRGRGAGPIYYCWTHGVNVSHVGADCRNKDPSHVDAATYFNPLGGN